MDKDYFYRPDIDRAPAELRVKLYEYLLECVELHAQHPEEGEYIAYEIAGLLATDLAKSLDENDPLFQAMELAGQLELPLHQRSKGATWARLKELLHEIS